MRSHRRFIVLVATVAVAASLAACSSSSSSSSSSSGVAGDALAQTKATVCGKLSEAATTVASAQSGDSADLTSKAESLANDLTNAAGIMKTVGLSSMAGDVESLATDLQNLATAGPTEVAQLESDAMAKITSAQTAVGC